MRSQNGDKNQKDICATRLLTRIPNRYIFVAGAISHVHWTLPHLGMVGNRAAELLDAGVQPSHVRVRDSFGRSGIWRRGGIPTCATCPAEGEGSPLTQHWWWWYLCAGYRCLQAQGWCFSSDAEEQRMSEHTHCRLQESWINEWRDELKKTFKTN